MLLIPSFNMFLSSLCFSFTHPHLTTTSEQWSLTECASCQYMLRTDSWADDGRGRRSEWTVDINEAFCPNRETAVNQVLECYLVSAPCQRRDETWTWTCCCWDMKVSLFDDLWGFSVSLVTRGHMSSLSVFPIKAPLCSTDTDGVFCPYSAFISSKFLSTSWKLTDTDETWKFKQDQQNTMKNNILEKLRLWQLVQNYRHIYNVSSPGTGTENSNRTAGRKEIGREMNVSWTAAKEK